jgi:hypothetical protein
MSTSGLLGFVHDGRETWTYCHYDSYPEVLGVQVRDWLAFTLRAAEDVDYLRAKVARLEHVSQAQPPTPEQLERYEPWEAEATEAREAHRAISTYWSDDWHEVLHKTQGDAGAILAVGLAVHHPTWPAESGCEWGYVLDLDTERLEVYRQGWYVGHRAGRFAGMAGAPMPLVATWPLHDLPSQADFICQANDNPPLEEEQRGVRPRAS